MVRVSFSWSRLAARQRSVLARTKARAHPLLDLCSRSWSGPTAGRNRLYHLLRGDAIGCALVKIGDGTKEQWKVLRVEHCGKPGRARSRLGDRCNKIEGYPTTPS